MKVTILMADECSAASVGSVSDFLQCANFLHHHFAEPTAHPQTLFECETASIDGLPVRCSGGLQLIPTRKLSHEDRPDLIIVPGFMFNIVSLLPGLQPICEWLTLQHQRGAYIANICTGAFISAEAGLLNDRFATTHWLFAGQFARHFPKVKLKVERTVTDDGLMMCSGGFNSSTDLLLHLICKFGSPQLASECSKKLVVDTATRSQIPYASPPFKKNHADAEILKVQIWLEKHITENISMEQVVEQFGFSMRNFIRRFKDATQQTPIQYLQNLRIEKAKYLLESGKESFDRITIYVGYEDGNSFRRLFKEKTGLTPSAYRKRFEMLHAS